MKFAGSVGRQEVKQALYSKKHFLLEKVSACGLFKTRVSISEPTGAVRKVLKSYSLRLVRGLWWGRIGE